ncbi:phosphatidate cytidylyltransferase [Coemansia erecta]|uniref:Phosphatidate cytidylyltransferase n=1 Tax=Coemansia erecta TaxID=147472 RepID=A0A9W8CRN5_9FUNG|nr:phosphatidate cytidylyltransferase [Coemansia erecta]
MVRVSKRGSASNMAAGGSGNSGGGSGDKSPAKLRNRKAAAGSSSSSKAKVQQQQPPQQQQQQGGRGDSEDEETDEDDSGEQEAPARDNSGTDNSSNIVPAEDSKKKWRNWRQRTTFTFVMIGGFLTVIALGPLSIMLMVLCLQVMIYREVISLSSVPKKERDLPWARAMNAYFLVCTEYYLYGHNLHRALKRHPWLEAHLQGVFAHHQFISFSLYLIGFVWFVGTLRKGYYRFQMGQFAWTHMALLLVVMQSQYMIENIFEGIFWFLLPIALVIVNDIFAYVFGFFFGRHRLIELSPKKTWEGYIGGGLTTMAFGFLLTALLSDWNFMRCPPPNLHMTVFSDVTCDVNPVFLPRDYQVPSAVAAVVSAVFGRQVTSVVIRPVQFHSLAISAFASLIAPFGGFFASGVKRAFNIKDFGNSIPGHGGVTDRFDCQFIMAAFSHTYYVSFIKLSTVTVSSVFSSFLAMNAQRQVELYQSIQEYLQTTGSIATADAAGAGVGAAAAASV